MMKIGFLIRYFYPRRGGAENNCYYLARELAKRHEVHVFCSDSHESDEIIDGINVHRSKEIFNVRYYFGIYPSIVKNIKKYPLDILHVHGFGFIQNDIAVKKLKLESPKTKLVCTPHGPFMALKKYGLTGKIFKKIYTRRIRKLLQDYDRIIEVNPDQKNWMKNEYGIDPRKIVFLPNGIDRSDYSVPSSKTKSSLIKKYGLNNKFILSYVGRIHDYKGLDQVIKVMPEIIKFQKNAVFVIFGKDAGDLTRLSNISKDLGIEDKIVFCKELGEEEKHAILDMSEIFIFPSEWEAFGIVMLEAMARKNAIVSTRTEGGLYLIKEGINGYLFDYGNLNELKKKVLVLLANEKKRREIQELNYKLSKKYLWEDIAKNLEAIYKGIK